LGKNNLNKEKTKIHTLAQGATALCVTVLNSNEAVQKLSAKEPVGKVKCGFLQG